MMHFTSLVITRFKLDGQTLWNTSRRLFKSVRKMAHQQTHHSLESVLKVFEEKKYVESPVVKELLNIFHKEMKSTEDLATDVPFKPYPFIVIEGLDAAGKSTVSKILSRILNANLRTTPPACINHLRFSFDSDLPTRTAFYSLGNYIEAAYIGKLIQESPVILDRFWHSTTTYSLAQWIHNEKNVNMLPMVGDSVYDWPSDLIKPNLVVFLDVSENERIKRHEKRNTTNTQQESLLKDSKIFRQNIRTAYKRMNDPNVYFIDADYSVEDVVDRILEKINNINE